MLLRSVGKEWTGKGIWHRSVNQTKEFFSLFFSYEYDHFLFNQTNHIISCIIIIIIIMIIMIIMSIINISFFCSHQVVDFRQGDMLDLSFKDWTDGTVVFMNSTCYDDELMAKLAHLTGLYKMKNKVKQSTYRVEQRRAVNKRFVPVSVSYQYHSGWSGLLFFLFLIL